MTDEELHRRFDALMKRVNDNHEMTLTDLRNLRTVVETTQEFVTRAPSLIVQALQKPLIDRLVNVEARVKKLEDGDEPRE